MVLLTATMIFGYVLNYSAEFSGIAGVLRLSSQGLIVLLGIWYVNIKNYYWAAPLLLAVVVLPLILMVVGVYARFTQANLSYITYFIFNSVAICCLATYFDGDVNKFIKIVSYTVLIILVSFFFRYGGLTLNIGTLFNNMINNTRGYTERYGMGFVNVNTMGLIASIGVVGAVRNIFQKNLVLLNISAIIFYAIALVNSGARTPLLAFGVAIIFDVILRLWTPLKLVLVTIFSGTLISVIGVIVYLSLGFGSSYKLYDLINAFTSNRLIFYTQALSIEKSFGGIWFGLGPMSTTFAKNTFLGAITIDGSAIYYVFTLGIVGAILILSYSIFLVINTVKLNERIVAFLLMYNIAYALFENLLYIPNAILSMFVSVVIFIALAKNYEVRRQSHDKITTNNIDANI